MSDQTEPRTGPAWRPWALRLLRLAIFAAVVYFVGRTFTEAWGQFTERGLRIDPLPAIGAGLVLTVAQLPMAWFWIRVVRAVGQPAPAVATTIAYVVGQIGKYVPGKATVVIIRTERLIDAARRSGGPAASAPSTATVAATVFYETLTHMAVGSLIAAVLSAVAPLGDSEWRLAIVGLSVGLAVVCITPTLPPVFSRLLARVTKSKRSAEHLESLTLGLAARGALASFSSWCLVAVAVWLAARSVGADADLGGAAFGSWLLTATLPVVAGFVSLLPAGVLVREALTLTVLSPLLGEGDALATTIALRVIWVAAEVLVCGSLLAAGSIGGGHEREAPRNPP